MLLETLGLNIAGSTGKCAVELERYSTLLLTWKQKDFEGYLEAGAQMMEVRCSRDIAGISQDSSWDVG